MTAGLAAEDPPGRWVASDPTSRDDLLGQLRLRGPHDLRHTFATWLEDAGIPARVIDELMGHAGGRGGGEPREGSAIGLRYRHTTPEMEAAWWPRSSSGWLFRSPLLAERPHRHTSTPFTPTSGCRADSTPTASVSANKGYRVQLCVPRRSPVRRGRGPLIPAPPWQVTTSRPGVIGLAHPMS